MVTECVLDSELCCREYGESTYSSLTGLLLDQYHTYVFFFMEQAVMAIAIYDIGSSNIPERSKHLSMASNWRKKGIRVEQE